jgi:peptide/nickel transport system permease protein
MSSAAALPPPMPTGPMEAPRSWLGGAMYDTVGRTGARIGLSWIVLVAFCALFAPFIANSRPYLIKMDGAWSSPLIQGLTQTDVILLVFAVAAAIVVFMRRWTPGQQSLLLLWILAAITPLVWWKGLADSARIMRETWPQYASHKTQIIQIILLGGCGMVDLFLLVWIPLRSSVPRRGRAVALIAMLLLGGALVWHPVNPPLAEVYSQYREQRQEGRVQWVLNAPIPYSPSDRLRDQFRPDQPHPWAPSRNHWLGTDVNGSDIMSNMVHACRIAMSIGFISTGISMAIGILVGGLMGYFVGWVDLLGMRLVEIFGSIPQLYLLLAFVAYWGRDIYLIMIIIGLTSWTGDARFVRAEFLRLRQLDFVQAGIASGLPLRSVLFRHLLPNALAPLLVSASFGVASAIVAESTLSFLGLGLVDEASWGRLLDMARSAGGGGFYWWLATFPGLAIFLTVLAYNLIGEAMRDALDPRLSK